MGVLKTLLHRMPALPAVCQVCGAWPSQPLCAACVQRFAPATTRCTRCARPVPQDVSMCGDCLLHPPEAVQRCVAAVDYRFPWDGLIARLKFRNEPGWAAPLAELMWHSAQHQQLLTSETTLVPVPVAPERLAQRGYNQAWELCKAVGRLSGLPALPEALVRLNGAPDQHRLPLSQRLDNLRGAFAAHPLQVARLRGSTAVLVDDVRTTGSTLHHAALALRQAGVVQVHALVLAQTPHANEVGPEMR
jgi:ComF family protein